MTIKDCLLLLPDGYRGMAENGLKNSMVGDWYLDHECSSLSDLLSALEDHSRENREALFWKGVKSWIHRGKKLPPFEIFSGLFDMFFPIISESVEETVSNEINFTS